MSKEIPMLFSMPMVQAIILLLKDQTRRFKGLEKINENPNEWEFVGLGANPEREKDDSLHAYFKMAKCDTWMHIKCPYGNIEDILWVRETWQHTKCLNINFEDENYDYVYKADNQPWQDIEGWTWKPSIFMPKEACRIKLLIENIKVERIKDISNADAIREGIEWKIKYPEECPDVKYYRDYLFKDRFAFGCGFGPKECYKSLWEKINGKESWEENPWVWVIKFRILKIKN